MVGGNKIQIGLILMNDDDTDTIRLLMWIEKLEHKISRLEREVVDIKGSLHKTAQDNISEDIKKMNVRLTDLETSLQHLIERTGKAIK
jgi:hypothetical protein